MKIPAGRYPHNAERKYYRGIMAAFVPWWRKLLQSLKDAGKLRRDDEESQELFDAAVIEWGLAALALEPLITEVANDVKNLTLLSFTQQMKAFAASKGPGATINNKIQFASWLGVQIFESEPGIEAEIADFRRANALLVKGIGEEAARRLETVVTDAVKNGTSTRDLAALINKEFGYNQNRAALIARDQIGKLNGNINRVRQTTAGIKAYTWNANLDSRVRPTHRERNGKVFSWAKPPADGHPGQPIRCRCTANPVFLDEYDFGLTREELVADQLRQSMTRARRAAEQATAGEIR